ncbi:MAG: ImmA/IrrE family metallo-endopeptidase [Actinomycetota bacterium]|nr:ImmA/IrrE family metallo-endopeptidase [Actinomycetota bacterium]
MLGRLRQLAPARALGDHETTFLAELQAGLLLDLAGLGEPPTPSGLITELPRVLVALRADLPVSGATQWGGQQWLVFIRDGEPVQRQRFSLAHEYKHCIDHRQGRTLYRGTGSYGPQRQAELAADAFAAALLMPEHWLRAAWENGLRDLTLLARRFEVSEAAMRRRLGHFGLDVTHALLEVA